MNEKLVNTLEAAIFSKMGHIRSETRSLGQIEEASFLVTAALNLVRFIYKWYPGQV